MSRKRVNLRNCVCDLNSGSGGATSWLAGLSDVVVNIDHAPSAPGGSTMRKPKSRKPRSKGKGRFCVLSHKGKTVHCYEDRETADRVADAFTKKGKSGAEYTVKER